MSPALAGEFFTTEPPGKLYIITVPMYIPIICVTGFPFLYTLINTCYPCLFYNGHPNRDQVMPHYGFESQFLDNQRCWPSYTWLAICVFFVLFCFVLRKGYASPLPIFNDFYLLLSWSHPLYIWGILTPYQIDDLHLFSPFPQVPFSVC